MSATSIDQSKEATTLTLGELLYTDAGVACVPEKDWLALVRAIAAGDENALRLLFQKTYPLMFTYLIRLTGNRGVTENLILEVFQDVWCQAPIFDSANGPVIGWIMRQARSSARAHARRAEPMQLSADRIVAWLMNDPIQADVGSRREPDDPRLQVALATLTATEREAIEAAFLEGLSYAEMAAQRGESIGTIKNWIRSGLSKLRASLQARGGEA